MLVHLVERSRKLLDAYYHSRSAIGVRQLLEDLNGQSVSTAAVGYRLFKEAIKGLDDEAAVEKLSSSDDMVVLPRIIYSADAVEIYPSLAEFSDPGRSAVGVTEDGEVWAIAEIDSKLEADAAKAEFWCDRLEMAAASAGSGRVHIWLVAPEGFDEDALTFLGDRGAFGSSRKQIELLRQLLNTRPDEHGTTYELAVPMGEEGELTATRTLKDIATRHQIPAKATMQIKTALVEALINAAEHSLSPDRRIELRFVVGASEIRISVENRGLRLTDRMPGNDPEQDQRRGWGLELMRKMMDDVRLEPTDDGTKLLMIKRFGPTAS
jgi:anti-sigma regulatory factor (Ser/Thr protein kinase)